MTTAPNRAGVEERAGSRLAGLDALRVATLICIVAYHCLGAVAFKAPPGRLGVEGESAAWLLSVLQNEVLIALSAYLFAQRRRDLGRTLLRLVEIYLFWTVIYLLEALAFRTDAGPFGRAEPLFLLLLGGAKYHLPFFPALAICLSVSAAAARLGSPRLWGMLAIAAAITRRALEQKTIDNATLGATQMLLLQGLTIAAYLPFGALGFQLRSQPGEAQKRALGRDALAFFAAAAVLVAAGLRIMAADWPTSTEFLMGGRAAATVGILVLGLGPPNVSPALRSFRVGLTGLAQLSLPVFLVHPLIIDLIASQRFFSAASLTTAGILFVCVAILSLSFARLARDVPKLVAMHVRSRGGQDF